MAEILTTIYVMLFIILVLQVAVFIILFKGSSQMAGLKKRVAIKKLQLEEAMLERQLKSSAMPTLTDLVNSGVIEPAPPEDKSQDGDDQDPKNRSKIGF